MTSTVDADKLHIFTAWHDTVRNRDLPATAALYSEDAILETPLALAVYPERHSGLVIGRASILTFFEDSIRKFPGDLGQWYRTGVMFVNGNQLTWEYPRAAPSGDQVDLIEMMQIESGLIVNHRVYWGWYGVRLLACSFASTDIGTSG
ncbi:SnoaL-like domain [Paraburkholderia caribensis MBA4]|uniref:SnoaL-like domain n=1 Tax=Paraburkholderia caribensis MBA4 TaxID=1323664 RepID=A0A0P0RGT6_9BURK|nr:nuclear transport factor 2 family protein [Paraburkholderia caribensis]ALL67726.1 SnoaL-like domain [Paraburkholderia caribensis MBA4]